MRNVERILVCFSGVKKGTILTFWLINIKLNMSFSTSTRVDELLNGFSLMKHLAFCDIVIFEMQWWLVGL
jgi:hypothetical protein